MVEVSIVDGRLAIFIFEDQAGLAGRVIEDAQCVEQGPVELEQVAECSAKPPADGGGRDVVAALTDALADAEEGQFRTGNPQIEQVNAVAALPEIADDAEVGTPGQRGFKREIGTGCRCLVDAFQDEAARTGQGGIGVEWGQAAGDEVGIDEVWAVGVAREEFGGKGGFTRAVGTRDDVAVTLGRAWRHARGVYRGLVWQASPGWEGGGDAEGKRDGRSVNEIRGYNGDEDGWTVGEPQIHTDGHG